MKIAFSGSHGTGKTSSVYKEASKQKLLNKGDVAVITEIARQCPLPINEKTTKKSQLWMFSDQLKTEIDYQINYDYIICDRSIVDYCAYAYFSDKHAFKNMYQGMWHICYSFIDTYDKIYFKTIKNNQYLVDDGVRSLDFKFQQDVEDKLIEIYNTLNYNKLEYI